MTLSEHHRYAAKTKTELIDEVTSLLKQLRAKNAEIVLLKKKLALYRSL
jgi:hypothetical protein